MFPAISNAFSVLSNADKRQRYDQYGSEAERSSSHRDDYSRGFEGTSLIFEKRYITTYHY